MVLSNICFVSHLNITSPLLPQQMKNLVVQHSINYPEKTKSSYQVSKYKCLRLKYDANLDQIIHLSNCITSESTNSQINFQPSIANFLLSPSSTLKKCNIHCNFQFPNPNGQSSTVQYMVWTSLPPPGLPCNFQFFWMLHSISLRWHPWCYSCFWECFLCGVSPSNSFTIL